MKKTKQEYEIELLALVPQIQKLEKRRSFLWKKVSTFENDEATEYLAGFPATMDEMNEEQLKYILFHCHKHTEVQYKFATKIFEQHGMFTTGFWEDTKQFAFALHGHTDLDKFKAFLEIIKPVYLPTIKGQNRSRGKIRNALNFLIYFDIQGSDGWSLLIDPTSDQAWVRAQYDRIEYEGTLDSVLEKLKINQKCYESSY